MSYNNLWVEWAKQIQAISQIGTTFSKDPYDLERYTQLKEIAYAMMAKLANTSIEQVENFFIPEKSYATPKVDVRAGVFQDDKILLVKERSDNKWTLPGGWADIGESPKQSIIREVEEESGYRIDQVELVALKDRNLHPYEKRTPSHIYKLFFYGHLIGGSPTPNTEISEIDFFAQDNIPDLSLGRTILEDIQLFYEVKNDIKKQIYVD